MSRHYLSTTENAQTASKGSFFSAFVAADAILVVILIAGILLG